MSHDIDESTGKPAIAYVGDMPWHGLGQRLQEGQPIDVWVKEAGLDWDIRKLPVQYEFAEKHQIMQDRFVLTRSDNGAALSVVSSDYHIVQPREVIEFYRELVKERGYKLETAGALDGGRKVWALAKTGMVEDVGGDASDKIGSYVLLASSCDKSIATTVTFTSIRVVCQNTLGFAFKDMKGQKRRHTKVYHSERFNPEQIKESLGLIDDAWKKFIETLNPMAKYQLDDASAKKYFESVFLSDKQIEEGKKLSDAKLTELQVIFSQFKSGKGQTMDTAKDKLWGALNAVTYYVDHVRGKSSGDRLDSAWFGAGASLKENAWTRAEQLLIT